MPVPQIVLKETFARVQAKLDSNQQLAARNTRHEYLLRALVSCGMCRLSCTVRQIQAGYRYYQCRGRTDALRAAQGVPEGFLGGGRGVGGVGAQAGGPGPPRGTLLAQQRQLDAVAQQRLEL